MEIPQSSVAETQEKFKLKTTEISKDFDEFMAKVARVENVLKGLNSKDELKQKIAMEKADYLLGNEDFDKDIDEDKLYLKTNRTVINHKAFQIEDNPDNMSKEMFMKNVEEDANRRAAERREMKAISNRHKTEGIKAFRNQDYVKALHSFNEAIKCIRDSPLLYNNRCLTYLKLGLPKNALEDTRHALRLNENSIKAHVYKAEALYKIGEKSESDRVIKEACDKFPNQVKFLKETQRSWQ